MWVGVGVFSFGGFGFDGVDGAPHFDLPQSTGLLTTGVQSLACFWFGLPGKQLSLSSRYTFLLFDGTQTGASPLK